MAGKFPLRHMRQHMRADLEGPHRKFAALVATAFCDNFDCPCSSCQRPHSRRVGTGGDLLLFDSVNGEVMTICSVPSEDFGAFIARHARWASCRGVKQYVLCMQTTPLVAGLAIGAAAYAGRALIQVGSKWQAAGSAVGRSFYKVRPQYFMCPACYNFAV